MKVTAISTARVIIIMCFTLLFTREQSQASFQLYDGRLELSGFLKETCYLRTSYNEKNFAKTKSDNDWHNSAVDYLMTSAYLETLFKIKESPNLTINFLGSVKYWYDAAPSLDDKLHDYIQNRDLRDYQKTNKFEDFLTEAYLDIIKGPWDIRIGKQIVTWGQLDVSRISDVVNPLDQRRGMPGIDNWEEVKQALWMIRGLYQSHLPGNLLFETIFNPGYYKFQKLPYEGTHWGPDYNGSGTGNNFSQPGKYHGYGVYHHLQSKWNHDAPEGWDKNNWEFGFRIQGYTWDIDWSLLYWNARMDNPVPVPKNAIPWMMPFVLDQVKQGVHAALGDPVKQDVQHARMVKGPVFRYPRMQTIGGTAQTWVRQLHNSIWRLEWFLDLDRSYVEAKGGSSFSPYDWTKSKDLGIAVSYQDKFDIPWWTKHIGTGRQASVTLTYLWEKILRFNSDMVINDYNHQHGHSTMEQISWFVMQEAFNNAWAFTCSGYVYIKMAYWMACPSISYYFPGDHWRADLAYAAYGGSTSGYKGESYAHKDKVILRLRYEF